MLTVAIWLICIPAAYGLWLVLSEEPTDPRVTQRELHSAHEAAQNRDQRMRLGLVRTRDLDRYQWRIAYLEAERTFWIRRWRRYWDGWVG